MPKTTYVHLVLTEHEAEALMAAVVHAEVEHWEENNRTGSMDRAERREWEAAQRGYSKVHAALRAARLPGVPAADTGAIEVRGR